MPIRIISKDYTDNFGNTTPFLKFNAGDLVTADIEIESNIFISSLASPIFYDYSLQEMTLSSGSWLSEGFRVGDTIEVTRFTQFGVPMGGVPDVVTITFVSDQVLKHSGTLFNAWAVNTNQEYMHIECISHNRQSVDFYFNLVKNGVQGNDFSLIDGEATRFTFDNIDILPVFANTSATILVNQSGQAFNGAQLQRLANVGNAYRFLLSVSFISTGYYDSEWFESSGCLKMRLKSAWSTINGEPFAQTINTISDDANTGWYNQPHNTSVVDSTLVQGVSDIDYSIPTTFDIIVNGSLFQMGIGGLYLSQDSLYYKNKTYSQREISMINYTKSIGIPLHNSFSNNLGAGYSLTINSITSLGSLHTINVTFTPNNAFNAFINSREDGDRTFYLWLKCGNINHLVFSDQLTKAPPVGGPLIFDETVEFLDHSQNVSDNSVNSFELTNLFDTEDDLAFFGTFLLEKNAIYETLTCRVEAFNTTTQDDFTLQQHSFNFASIPLSNAGIYLANQTLTVNPLLPNTSVKRDANFNRFDAIDNLTHYGVSIYYPIVLRWEYWLEQLNANVDFYPNNNKNWQQFSDLGDWIVRLEIELIRDGLSYVYSKEIDIFEYNNANEITSEIELVRMVNNTVTTIIPQGEILKVVATHELVIGQWNQTETWGQIRCYPTENAPPWIISTEIDYDNNTSNPLIPISGTVATLSFPNPETAVVECLFDSNLIDLNNGVTFTAKIKDKKKTILPPVDKTTAPNDLPKTTSPNNVQKTLAQ